ncbi:hypothetical protein [Streptomyces sp. LN500]|uniref:hypothetical protein n=1 Tax=Streptomyces sp. LN500 TaxID=3112978 RepID=UPI0037213AC8
MSTVDSSGRYMIMGPVANQDGMSSSPRPHSGMSYEERDGRCRVGGSQSQVGLRVVSRASTPPRSSISARRTRSAVASVRTCGHSGAMDEV